MQEGGGGGGAEGSRVGLLSQAFQTSTPEEQMRMEEKIKGGGGGASRRQQSRLIESGIPDLRPKEQMRMEGEVKEGGGGVLPVRGAGFRQGSQIRTLWPRLLRLWPSPGPPASPLAGRSPGAATPGGPPVRPRAGPGGGRGSKRGFGGAWPVLQGDRRDERQEAKEGREGGREGALGLCHVPEPHLDALHSRVCFVKL